MWFIKFDTFLVIFIIRQSFFDDLKEECPVDALRACVFIHLPHILKNNGEFRRK